MIEIKLIKNAANEAITNCGSEIEMLEKIEKIKASLVNGSESYIHFGNLILRLKRILKSQVRSEQPIEYYDNQINRIQDSAVDCIKNLSINEVGVPIEYDERKGIIYMVCDPDGELLFKFSGNLLNSLPEGKGTAKYLDGTYFEGRFQNGMREGQGKLFDKSHRLLRDGIWKKDKFIKKNAISYFADEYIAASHIKEGESTVLLDDELMIIPDLHQSGLLAFPITGDSMAPTFSETDTVVIQELTDLSELINNQTYVLFHENRLLLKVIQLKNDSEGNIVLRLISENHIKHQPFEIKPNSNTKLYKVVLQIIKHQ